MSDLVEDLRAELADILGVKPGHSLTGDYAALKGDAERLARVVEGHTNTALAHATRFVYGNGRAQITVDYEPGWGHGDVPWVVRSFHPMERHPDRATALRRAHELAQE